MRILNLLLLYFVYGDEQASFRNRDESCRGDVVDRIERLRNLEDELLVKGILE